MQSWDLNSGQCDLKGMVFIFRLYYALQFWFLMYKQDQYHPALPISLHCCEDEPGNTRTHRTRIIHKNMS